ncbi:Os06g0117101, partial [Oryza sativa Japonica Group]
PLRSPPITSSTSSTSAPPPPPLSFGGGRDQERPTTGESRSDRQPLLPVAGRSGSGELGSGRRPLSLAVDERGSESGGELGGGQERERGRGGGSPAAAGLIRWSGWWRWI